MDWTELLKGNNAMLLALGLAAAALGSLNPAVMAKVKALGQGILSWTKGGTNTPTTPVTFDEANIHQTVTNLMNYFASKNDLEGAKYAARIGTHLYEKVLISE